jgi:hypothetical protein
MQKILGRYRAKLGNPHGRATLTFVIEQLEPEISVGFKRIYACLPMFTLKDSKPLIRKELIEYLHTCQWIRLNLVAPQLIPSS